MQNLQSVLQLLSTACSAALSPDELSRVEEFRLRAGQVPTAVIGGAERRLCTQRVTCSELERLLATAMEHSCYAVAEKLREGFLTLPGGHRLGVCGTAAIQNGTVISLRDISSVCIRIARQIPAAPDGVEHWLDRPTLILGPPGSGKTTLLRDCIRLLSYKGQRVSVADERGELAGCCGGMPQMDIGSTADVLSGCAKSAAVLMLLRTMNTQWIAVDEITAPEDMDAIAQCSYCGVKILATAHASCAADLQRRPLYQQLCSLGIFEKLMILDAQKRVRLERMG